MVRAVVVVALTRLVIKEGLVEVDVIVDVVYAVLVDVIVVTPVKLLILLADVRIEDVAGDRREPGA